MQCFQDEMMSGRDEHLSRVLQSWEVKTEQYYNKLCGVFGSSEYFQQFRSSYAAADFPYDEEYDESLCECIF